MRGAELPCLEPLKPRFMGESYGWEGYKSEPKRAFRWKVTVKRAKVSNGEDGGLSCPAADSGGKPTTTNPKGSEVKP